MLGVLLKVLTDRTNDDLFELFFGSSSENMILDLFLCS